MTTAQPLCYCFSHSYADVETEVAAGKPDEIQQDIIRRCGAGEARCAETNPSGSCCLGDVRKAYASARLEPSVTGVARTQSQVEPSAESCCEPLRGVDGGNTNDDSARRPRSVWSATGAVLLALASSACCWLPLLLVGVGVSAAGVGNFFEPLRPYLLVLTSVLLLAGFYVLYLRAPRCEPNGSCAPTTIAVRSRQRGLFWCASVLAICFMLFPEYGMPLFAGASNAAPATPEALANADQRAYRVTGMTCEGCATGLASQLSALPNVLSAEVDYDAELARLRLISSAPDGPVLGAISDSGFGVERIE